MNFRTLTLLVALCVHAGLLATPRDTRAADDAPPNIIVIFCDNLGYGDLGCFGSTVHRTPNVDRMAAEGLKLTAFYSTSGVCTPSRASLQTGCYPRRVGLHETTPDGAVLRPVSTHGLHPDEITIAEILKQRGYATTIVGKWHLGDQPPFLPTRQGYDEYFGIPYSDDMVGGKRPGWPPLPLMEGERVIEAPVDRNPLTKRYTERVIDFVERHRDGPFFVILSHAMPGSTPHPFASEAFRGKSRNGGWGDAVEEIDWSTGQILDTLKRLDLDERTLVIWTSDNGAPRFKTPAGTNAPFKTWGYTATEGGQRVPCVVRWPGRVPAGVTSDALCTMMDVLPTCAKLASAAPPDDRVIDGHDISGVLFGGADAASPYDAFFYYQRGDLQAVRGPRWKLQLTNGKLYDMRDDPRETTDVAAAHADVVARLRAAADRARADLGDGDKRGSGQRPVGDFAHPTPRVLE
ncbi:MAG: sulfatase-like hydrolase/transferase [Phycisphaera sp.]|nr:sulfatase-like hydrolase/transferase [Phycisphaera sp.]